MTGDEGETLGMAAGTVAPHDVMGPPPIGGMVTSSGSRTETDSDRHGVGSSGKGLRLPSSIPSCTSGLSVNQQRLCVMAGMEGKRS
jgi:hypothetical protein